MIIPNTNTENQLHLANTELSRQIALLEEKLLEKERTGEALKDSEKRYRRLFESAKDGILILDADTGKVVDVNPFLLKLLGYSYDAIYGKYIWELGVFKDIAASKDAFRALQTNDYIRYDDLPLETMDGHPIAVEFVSNVYLVDHSTVIQCNIRDITARKRTDAERKQLMAAIEQTGETIIMTDAKGIIQFVNPAFVRTTGYSREEVLGRNPNILKSGKQDDVFYRNLWETISDGRIWTGLMVNKRKDGSLYTDETTISPVRDPSGRITSYVAVIRDITDNLRLAAQLQQAQKMESIGRLAGGVAHDFNNMLSIIMGRAELAMMKLSPSDRVYNDLREIEAAGRRSANLTHQLLAFARKETIAPIILNLNSVTGNMLKMLRRMIGEDIDIVWKPSIDPWPVKMDPSQIDQLLANLVVNARDAIKGVGKVIIETKNMVLDDGFCSVHADFIPGHYIQLAVSDSGCGMDKEILANIFEPFFTTKPMGQGTGLGLATVYGIVRQNNGFINVYSEPDEGTTFRMYFPRYRGKSAVALTETATEAAIGGSEKVLLVEDEPAILKMTETMLQKLGYTILTARSPGEAIRIHEECVGEIHLLITDVVMPDMNGRDLAKRLLAGHPNLKHLFMSGFTADIIARHGIFDAGLHFIQKPFSLKELAVKVREALGDVKVH
ncbi:MAG: PAS domain-containing sensor histidine kinase [Desulfobacteraceae bacterium]|nr:MAG: PAS domain-containing sensor histidine kinase [Desulfobacteraceae bacterium]